MENRRSTTFLVRHPALKEVDGLVASALPHWEESATVGRRMGRCISLLKVLLSNACIYNCAYCINRRTNDLPRATFTPEELAEITIEFYRRNYIEGLFLSSAVIKNPDYTMELMIRTLSLLRKQYRFLGYIHAKIIPSSSPELIDKSGCLPIG